MEEWKQFKDTVYEVSNLGQIRNKETQKILSQHDSTGYYQVGLFLNNKLKTFYVHRVVAETWIVNHNDLKIVNHIDGNKFNNRADNLEWVTQSDNLKHAHKNKLSSEEIKRRIQKKLDQINKLMLLL